MKIETIDICADVRDNYGDMGWVLEFLVMAGIAPRYRIVTDHVSALGSFLEKTHTPLPHYTLIEKGAYRPKKNSLIILGLHAHYDMSIFPAGSAVIRVNYLTYSPWYRGVHDQEHIFSTPERPIRELTYSPLSGTGGVWKYERSEIRRDQWLEKMNLPTMLSEKIWIPIFVYSSTLTHLNPDEIESDTVIFFVGEAPSILHENMLHLPWLAREDFWSLIDLSDISLLRGEISALRGLMSGRPLLWDMYKGIGGWNTDDSAAYLDFIGASIGLRELHDRINTGKSWSIGDIRSMKNEWKDINFSLIPDFRKTLEKTIDSFGFSL